MLDITHIFDFFSDAKSGFGCVGDQLYLSCPNNKTIFVTSAEYGEYSQPCGEGQCCLPNPFDCVEQVSQNNNANWIDLKLTCDNETECSYLFQGSTFVQKCTVAEPVSYMNVFYQCLPGDNLTQFEYDMGCKLNIWPITTPN